MITMNNLKHFEERLVKLETGINNISSNGNEERKKDLEEMAKIAKSFDMTEMTSDIKLLKDNFLNLKDNIEKKLQKVEMLQSQFLNIEKRGKLPQCKEDVNRININLKTLDAKLNRIENKLNVLDKALKNIDATIPIIIE